MAKVTKVVLHELSVSTKVVTLHSPQRHGSAVAKHKSVCEIAIDVIPFMKCHSNPFQVSGLGCRKQKGPQQFGASMCVQLSSLIHAKSDLPSAGLRTTLMHIVDKGGFLSIIVNPTPFPVNVGLRLRRATCPLLHQLFGPLVRYRTQPGPHRV